MNNRTHDRIFRALSVGLLSSELSPAELRTLSKNLRNPLFIEEFSGLVTQISSFVEHIRRPAARVTVSSRSEWLKRATELIVERGLTKDQVKAGINALYPQMHQACRTKQTLSGLLRCVSNYAPDATLQDLQRWLESGGGPADEYLEGIISK